MSLQWMFFIVWTRCNKLAISLFAVFNGFFFILYFVFRSVCITLK